MRTFVLTVGRQYFTQHGCHVIMLNFGSRSHVNFIDCMFYNDSMFVEHSNENNISVLFIVCIANHYYVKIVEKCQSEIRIPNRIQNSNF